MKHPLFAATALALSLAACSPSAIDPPTTNSNMAETDMVLPPANGPAMAPVATPMPGPSPTATDEAKVLTLEGLGALKIGQPVPGATSWAARGAQASDACTTVSSPDYPGVYAIVEGGKVRRISVGKRSDVKLIEGIGVGATEQQVAGAFPGFRDTPHKYVDAPAKYLTAPNAESGDPALRFEIGSDRTVTIIHVGTAPVLEYIEGCS
ncbi:MULTISPECIES: hypothetical protein [unclassified Sphingomonas]|uniref:hypothetical protein n=1 Tax=unclassified Sphingomonas TaxID=196159 RepID=UPI000BCA2954|nr:MAG: hypothetical protein B7Y98_06105 [Sphingomonas sp. 32-62-10]